MYMNIGNGKKSFRFLDSLNFLQMALKDFPKTFGITELKKGYFPHFFNKKCNENYIGPMPSNKHYGPNSMSTKDRAVFMEWYKSQELKIFDIAKEIRDCLSDVKLLKEGCEKLRAIFISQTDCDPFSYITIASACMAIYRNKFMPRNGIAVINDIEMDGHSKSSIMWLEHIAKKEKIFIQHARNDREAVIKDTK